ncbi:MULTISPECIES: DUF4168 domain-containing protein [unclassified Anabaena]|uniref:DUF4168 domain-containing protein n=1 Tax=unclassified Anabaena TaxID=2619674 RepID=UPI0039C758F4
MLKQLLKVSSVFIFLLAGNLSALAQAPEAQPQGTPAPTAPQTQQSPEQAVSPEELQQFANVIPRLQEIGQTAQQKFAQVIEKSDLSVERFQELVQAQQSPEAKPSTPVTPEEQQSFNQVVTQIQSIQRETFSEQEQVVRSGGIEPERFSQIVAAVQRNPALQQQVQQLLQNNQKN